MHTHETKHKTTEAPPLIVLFWFYMCENVALILSVFNGGVSYG